ncbi:hypothetical protein HHK36_005810 [Tetracentron sinense]|uniref:HMA domain-containing protein n=1 Tax=Tetracentron sinense TaxID=13715 RepID=A0A834ZUZ9_TETSI|nr:hypothetical protein HHK36_005810 [Tetracentron sinense]
MAAKVALSSSLSTIPSLPPNSSSLSPLSCTQFFSPKKRVHHFKIHANLGGGDGDIKQGGKKKFITREEEPEQYWQTAGEREGENPMKTPLPYIIIFGMSTPFVILAIAFANGWIKCVALAALFVKEQPRPVRSQENKEEEKKEEKKEESKEEPQEIVLKVDMHCEACARKVERALRGFQGPNLRWFTHLIELYISGVEDVMTDSKSHKVVVKGKTADPITVCQRIQKKCGRRAEIISPLQKTPEEEKKEGDKDKKEEKKEEPPAVITIKLKVSMHCEACAEALQKCIGKIEGVESVAADLMSDQVVVKGVLDPAKLVENVYKRTKKQASIVKDEEKKEEEKKEEEKKEGENKEGEEGKGEYEKKSEANRSEYWPPKYNLEYAYPPQIFSDENPNACFVM